MMTKYKFYFLILLLFLILPHQGMSKPRSGSASTAEIAAIVNEEMISIMDLRNRAKLLAVLSGQPWSEAFYEKVAPQLLETLVSESLQRQQADSYKIKIGKEEIKNAIIRLEKMNNQNEGFLKALLKQSNIPFEVMEKQIMANLAWDIISREMFKSSLQVSKNEVDLYIQRLEANRDRPHHHLAEIVISVDSPSQEQKARRKATEIISYLNQGANFSALAQQFSDAPTKAQGGDIGWIPKGELESSLNQAVERLHPHGFTQPIRTQDGYVILYLIDQKDTSPEMAAQTIYTHKRINFPLAVTASDEKAYEVYNKALSVSQNARSCEMLVNLAKSAGNDVEIKEVGEVKAQDLSPPVFGVLSKLTPCKEGSEAKKCQASQPIRSEIGVLLFMVCKKETIPAGKVDREQVENTIANQKLQKLMVREMRNLQRAAHVVNKLEEASERTVLAHKH